VDQACGALKRRPVGVEAEPSPYRAEAEGRDRGGIPWHSQSATRVLDHRSGRNPEHDSTSKYCGSGHMTLPLVPVIFSPEFSFFGLGLLLGLLRNILGFE
jgi:hypothetical protein